MRYFEPWKRVVAAVGGVRRWARVALPGAWAPPTRRRLLGRCPLRFPRALPEAPRPARVLEAAPGMGGREWPRLLLLCIIVTQTISCFLQAPESAKSASQGRETPFVVALLCGIGKDGKGLTLATQRWGRDCGHRDSLVTPAWTPTPWPLPFSAKLPLSFLSAEGQLEFAVLLSLFVTRSNFRSSPGRWARKGSA